MKGKSLPSGIDSFDIRKAVEKIVFDRARNFLTGVRKEEIGEEIVNALLSENIITVCVDDTVRLNMIFLRIFVLRDLLIVSMIIAKKFLPISLCKQLVFYPYLISSINASLQLFKL